MLSAVYVLWMALLVAGLDAYSARICGTNGYSDSVRHYNYNPNAWNAITGGFSCMGINNSVPSFDATWNWPDGDSSVHSYSYVSFVGTALPVVLSDIARLHVAAKWGMAPGFALLPSPNSSIVAQQLDSAGLAAANVKANVALDLFLDANQSKAADSTTASTEIMIWLTAVGGAQALGYTAHSCHSQAMGGVEYLLYTGTNQRGLAVYTWVAQGNVTVLDADLSPLVQYLWRNSFISANLSIGLLQLGSEAYSSDGNVSFSAANYGLDLQTGTPPSVNVSTAPTDCPSGTVRRRSSGLGVWLAAAACITMAHLHRC